MLRVALKRLKRPTIKKIRGRKKRWLFFVFGVFRVFLGRAQVPVGARGKEIETCVGFLGCNGSGTCSKLDVKDLIRHFENA